MNLITLVSPIGPMILTFGKLVEETDKQLIFTDGTVLKAEVIELPKELK